jgi:hypothetical protein
MPDDEWLHVHRTGPASVAIYRRGAHVGFVPRDDPHRPEIPPRGEIQNQTPSSRRRAAFALGNAECDWIATSLLTYRHLPPRDQVKRDIDCLRRRWRSRWDEPPDAWIMEIQQRGAPHFHLFHARQSNFGLSCSVARPTEVTRTDGTPVTVLRGGVDHWLVEAWCDITRADETARWFHRQGIIEVLRSSDAAGRYVAAEIGKEHQKKLPERYKEGLGRWWWLAKRWRPRARYAGTINMDLYPFDFPLAHIWNAEDLAVAFEDVWRVGAEDATLAP